MLSFNQKKQSKQQMLNHREELQNDQFLYRNNKYDCFSNFYLCPVRYQQMDFDNSEEAYLFMKTLDMSEREQVIG